jgi:CRP-like cAMP-binding protein
MSKKEAVRLLGSVPLFEGLSQRELDTIYRAAKETEFEPGHDIVEQGATGVGFHLILGGKADVLVGGRKRASLGEGDYFGEMSLLDGGPRSATVRTATHVRTLALTSWTFLPILDKMPSIARKMLVELSRRLRGLEKSLQH